MVCRKIVAMHATLKAGVNNFSLWYLSRDSNRGQAHMASSTKHGIVYQLNTVRLLNLSPVWLRITENLNIYLFLW